MKTYRVFAYLIAAEVVVQGALLALGMFRFGAWIADGGVATKETMAERSTFPGSTGLRLHGANGALWIPLLALGFLGVAVVTRRSIDGGVRWAAAVVGLVILQATLGFLSLAVPNLGVLHAVNAFLLLLVAGRAGHRARARATTPADAQRARVGPRIGTP